MVSAAVPRTLDILRVEDDPRVLAATMDEVGQRYTELMIPNDKVEAASALRPINQRAEFGKSIMLFDGVPRNELEALGETRTPSVADLFVAKMQPRTST